MSPPSVSCPDILPQSVSAMLRAQELHRQHQSPYVPHRKIDSKAMIGFPKKAHVEFSGSFTIFVAIFFSQKESMLVTEALGATD